MEGLRHGNTYREVECKKCCALLSYCDKDIIKKSDCYEVFGGDFYIYSEKYIICPECGSEIWFSRVIDGKETVKKN